MDPITIWFIIGGGFVLIFVYVLVQFVIFKVFSRRPLDLHGTVARDAAGPIEEESLAQAVSVRCAKCGKAETLEWKEVTGRGTIYSYCVMYDSRIKPLQADQPFNIAVISLDEDPEIKFLSSLPGTPLDQVPVGGNVEVTWEDVGEGQLVHEWRVV